MTKKKAMLITYFLGGFGVHRFMAKKTGTGILWLLTGGCFGIGTLCDFVHVCRGEFRDKNGYVWGNDDHQVGVSKTAAEIITFFLGGTGIHRFITGKTGTGIFWLFSGGCLGIGWLIDFIQVCRGEFKDINGNVWGNTNTMQQDIYTMPVNTGQSNNNISVRTQVNLDNRNTICPNYGNEVLSEKKFCTNCGKPLDEKVQFCPHCGTPKNGKNSTVNPVNREPEQVEINNGNMTGTDTGTQGKGMSCPTNRVIYSNLF